MTTKVLIVDPDITFAVGVKRALEQSGDCKVTAFANGQAAVELVRVEPQDVTIIDFNLGDMDIGEVIGALRGVQPDLFILVSPRTSAQIERMQSLDVQGSITKPYYARQLGPVIREAAAARSRLARRNKPDSRPLPTPPPVLPEAPRIIRRSSAPETRPTPTPPEPMPSVSPDFDAALAELPAIITEPPPQADDTFRRHMAAMLPEKPATPGGLRKSLESVVLSSAPVSEEATIADVVTGKPLIDPPVASLADTDKAAASNKTAEPPPDEPNFATAALDALDTVKTEPFSLKTYVETVEKETGRPLPGWAHSTIEELDQPTLVEPAFVEQALATPTPPPQTPSPQPDSATPTPEPSNQPIAEVALSLTQLAVGMAARLTLLTRADQPVAVAGELSERAVAGIAETINEAWRSGSDEGSALIRYLQIPGIGDFMLYSTQTVDDMRLSMLFPAETSLRIIRKQTRQLLDGLEKQRGASPAATLESEAATTLISRPTDPQPPAGLRESAQSISAAPSAEIAAPVAPEAVPGPLSAYSFVWLPGNEPISPDQVVQISGWLQEVAKENGWQIESVDVQTAHVTLQVAIPPTATPSVAVETFMSATARRAETPNLWADAYYVVPSDRPVTQQEIAQFVSYRKDAETVAPPGLSGPH